MLYQLTSSALPIQPLVLSSILTDHYPYMLRKNYRHALAELSTLQLKTCFAAKNNCLCLPVKATQGEPIDSNTVDIINNVLKTIDEEEQRFLQERKTVLQAIADKTKLSFDNPIESLQQ